MTEAPKKAAKPVSRKNGKSFVYIIGKGIATCLFKTFLPVKYHNRDKLQSNPPCIMIGNHLSFMDPVIMGVAIPKHQVRFIGKKELWKNKLVAAIFNAMRMIPVDRHNSDMQAMRSCMAVLREGGILGIFPEGTRHHQGLMEELESGVSMIALRSKAPLVPFYIAGKVRLFHTLHVYIGDPIPTDDLVSQGINKDTCDALLTRITETYARLAAAHTDA